MALIIQAEAADSFDVASGKWSKKKANVSNLICHGRRTEDVASDDMCSLGFGDIGNAFGKDCIAIVSMAVTSEEAY